MFKAQTQVRVRYGETDKMGVVYYGNYALYFEQARTEALRMLGVTYKSLEDSGIMMPVVNLQINYKKSALYDDVLYITTIFKTLPTAKILIDYEVSNEAGDLICDGTTTLVFVDMNTQKVTRCPAAVIQKMSPYFSTT